MRRLAAIILILIPFFASAQNLVPNGNFETYTTCPGSSTASGIHYCTGWSSMITNTSPDFFHTCSQFNTGIPLNNFGYQQSASGNGYAGIVTAKSNNFREVITRQIQKMVIGVTYEGSISISLADSSRWASNNINFFFFNNLGIINQSNIYSITPQIDLRSAGIQYDSTHWTRLSGTFIADSAYDNIAIGGFLHDTLINVDSNASSMGYTYAYYYIDSVVVKAVNSVYIDSLSDTVLCVNDTFHIGYKTTKKFNPNNVFTAQLSDKNGNFNTLKNLGIYSSDTSGVIMGILPDDIDIGTGYSLRIISSSPADTSIVYYRSLDIGNLDSAGISFYSNSPVCENQTLSIGMLYNTNLGTSHVWTGPSNFASTLSTPSIANMAAANVGNYYVNTHVFGCVQLDTVTVQMNAIAKPVAGSNTPICETDTLHLTASTTTNNVTYSWVGPNNFSSNSPSPYISAATLDATGAYVVTTSISGCSRKDTVAVTVRKIPGSITLSSNTPLCVDDTLRLYSDNQNGNVSFSWAGPNNFSSKSKDTIIANTTASNTGWYYLSVDSNGCVYEDSLYASVAPRPNIPTVSSNGPVCENDTLKLYASSTTSNVTYTWNGPAGFYIKDQNPVIDRTPGNGSGNYNVIVSLNGCTRVGSVAVTVKPAPDSITVSNNGPICTGDTLRLLADSSAGAVTYAWTGPNSFGSIANDTIISNASINRTGWYKMTVNRNGCTYTDSTYAIVFQRPPTPVISYNSPLCVGDTLALSASGSSAYTYTWNGTGSFNATTQNPKRPNAQPTYAGNYQVTATAGNGCISYPGNANITLNPLPFVVISSLPKDTVCENAYAVFTALPANVGPGPQYKWYVNNTLQAAAGPSFSTNTLNNGDVVYCEMTEYTKCVAPSTDQSNNLQMRVLPPIIPSVTITSTPNGGPIPANSYIKFNATASNAGSNPSYQWQVNRTDVVGATADVWSTNTLTNGDTVSVIVTSSYICAQPNALPSNDIVVNIADGIEDIADGYDLSLYPNPNRGQFMIRGTLPASANVTIKILNMLGQTIYMQQHEGQSNELNIPIELNSPASGIYLLQLEVDGSNIFRKFRID